MNSRTPNFKSSTLTARPRSATHKKEDEDDEPLKMTIALVFETSVTVNNIPTRDCTTPDDHIPPYTKTSVHVKIAFHKEMT